MQITKHEFDDNDGLLYRWKLLKPSALPTFGGSLGELHVY